MENNVILSQIPISELLSQMEEMVRRVVHAEQTKQDSEKLISPSVTIKLFEPAISKITLTKWTNDGLLKSYRIGGRVYYKQSEILEAAKTLKRYKAKP